MILWLAQGFGIGRIPLAPGTFGSVVGVLWFAVLIASGNLWIYCVGTLAGLGLSVWLCGAAERILRQTDPGSVVLDEIAAIPVCFAAWLGFIIYHQGRMAVLDDFFAGRNWLLSFGVFALFRFFDVIKPWPVRQSQVLPGGWGVTVDDFLAALYVNVVVLVLVWLKPGLLLRA